MILTKALLAATLLTAPFSGMNSALTTNPITQEVQPRLFGTLTSGWLTSTDGYSQIQVTYTHELATNRIVYINSIVAVRLTNGSAISQFWRLGESINGNVATINIGYRLGSGSEDRLGTYHLVV